LRTATSKKRKGRERVGEVGKGGRPYVLCACLARVRWRSSRPPHHRSRREVELSRVGVCERVQGGIPEYLLL
jgi:hypothetical protein